MISALSATSAPFINTIPSNSCESSPSTPSTMTSTSTLSNASHLDNQTPKMNGTSPATLHEADIQQRSSKNVWVSRDQQTTSGFPTLRDSRGSPGVGSSATNGPSPATGNSLLSATNTRGVNGSGRRFETTSSDFPALAEVRSPAAGSPTWNKSNNASGGNTRSPSVNGRDEKGEEALAVPSGSGKKNKWVPIPAAEMQAALDQARPPRSHSHSRASSRRNSVGELRRDRRLPDESSTTGTPAIRRKGFATPTFGAGGGSGSVSKSGTANPSPGAMSTLPPQPQPSTPLRRKAPQLSAPVTGMWPIPPPPAEERRKNFGSFDSTEPEPESTELVESQIERHPKQCGRFGVAVGVPLGERNQRRTVACRPLSTANDVEDDWTGDGRWNFGILGTFDRRVGLQRGGPGSSSNYNGPIHSPRARGGRGRGMGGMRGVRGGYRGGPGFRSSPADSDYAMLPPMPPMDQFGSPAIPYGFNPYAYGPYGPPMPPMWNPYAPYGGMPIMPPPPPPALLGSTAPPPIPITNVGYMLDQTRYYVLGQVEYYFSTQNMYQDLYLRQQMDSQGWIPVSTVASFNRLRRLTPETQIVREMMMLSSLVELSHDGEKARMGHGQWATFVLPDAQDASASSAASEPTMGGTSPATSVDADGGADGKGALGLLGVGGGEGA